MVTVRQRTRNEGGVTFAHVVVENDRSQRRRVRLALHVEGAVWPPRRRGRPEAGWDADGVTLVVAGGDTRGLGFATPASVTGDVVDVVADDPHGADGGATGKRGEAQAADPGSDGSLSTAAVVDALGAFAPPLAATPRADANGDGADAPGAGSTDDASASGPTTGSSDDAGAAPRRRGER